jgi:hypothetical protein
MVRRPLLMISIAAMLGACGDSSTEKDTKAAAKLYDELAVQYCEYIFRCCDPGEVTAVAVKRFTDKASCLSYMKLDYLLDSYALQLSAAQGAVEVLDTNVDDCVAAMKASTCGTPYYQLKTPTACEHVTLMTGLREAGQGCSATYECSPGHNCVKPYSSSNTGVCVPFRKKGEPCSSSTSSKATCAKGLACANPKDGIRTCKAPAKQGESCAEITCDMVNDPDLFCDYKDPNDPDQGRVCKKRGVDGAPCKSQSHCKTGLFCDTYTDPGNPQCRTPAGAGQPCKTTTQCKTDHYCDTNSDPMNPTCQPQLDEGQPCQTGTQCKSLQCDYNTQTCKPGGGTPGAVVCDGK